MRLIKSRNTKPELTVRKILRELGYLGYRLHRKDLPGSPDIVFIGRKKIIFVNGCFWHGHDCKAGQRLPTVNKEYWENKIENNKKRDKNNISLLAQHGWDILTVWSCELKNIDMVKMKLAFFLK